MKSVSFRKLSVLGTILLAASAVTAAILPQRSNDLKVDGSADNATLRSQSGVGGGGGALSCVADNTLNFSCHQSALQFTGTGAASDQFPNIVTANNTSQSIKNNGIDTTSHV